MSEAAERPVARVPPPHLTACAGLVMGGADAIPGVSGGTIALILGIYERFIDALHTVVRAPFLLRRREGRARIAAALAFLVPLGVGVLVAYYLATRLLVGPTDSPGIMRRPETAPASYAFFFGLVLFSLREPWRRISDRSARVYLATGFGFAAALVFVGLPHGQSEPSMLLVLFAGAGAISVMLLPGVSGSLFLVIIGQYTVVAGAVHDREWSILLVFAAGLGLGVVSFVPVLRILLVRARDVTLAMLTGLMAGSLRALWPWKTSYEPREEMANVTVGDGIPWVVLAFVAGGAVVTLLARFERRLQGRGA